MDPRLQRRLEDSNLAPSDWPRVVPIIEAICTHNHIQPTDMDAWSLGSLYKLPTPPPYAYDDFVIGVLAGTGLVLGREKGAFKKKMDFKAIELDKLGNVQFWPDDQQLGSNWGTCDLQAVSSGGQNLFRLGWGWSGAAMTGAMRERDRIASVLTDPPAQQRSVEEYRRDIREAAQAYLLMDNGRALPVAVSATEGQRMLAEAREHGDEMITFPTDLAGLPNVQLVSTIIRVVPPGDVAHMERPELGY